MQFLIISTNHAGGVIIKDTVTDSQQTYYGYTIKQAIKKHRKNGGLKYKHFEKIYI